MFYSNHSISKCWLWSDEDKRFWDPGLLTDKLDEENCSIVDTEKEALVSNISFKSTFCMLEGGALPGFLT